MKTVPIPEIVSTPVSVMTRSSLAMLAAQIWLEYNRTEKLVTQEECFQLAIFALAGTVEIAERVNNDGVIVPRKISATIQ